MSVEPTCLCVSQCCRILVRVCQGRNVIVEDILKMLTMFVIVCGVYALYYTTQKHRYVFFRQWYVQFRHRIYNVHVKRVLIVVTQLELTAKVTTASI